MKGMSALIAGITAACVVSSMAEATPTILAYDNLTLSGGLADDDIHAHATVQLGDEDFTAEVHTYGASNIVVQDVKFYPGGTTGWHQHPGVVMLTLTADSGPVEWYDSHCGKVTYKAGDSWTEGTKLHDVVVPGPTSAHFLITYIVPAVAMPGTNKRTDEPAPKCAKALGLR